MKAKRLTLEQKLAKHFGVKVAEGSKSVKAVNVDERTVKFVANTYFLIDSDYDMLIPGCAKKSISDRGPLSNATAKIKHQSDHVLNTKNVVGRITVLDERVIDGLTVLYCESHIAETSKGNDDLVNYKEEIYDNHSIGFIYRSLVMAEKNSTDETSRKAWEEFYPLAINPEKADEYGFFWVVKEIELFEISVVSFGANSLTPNLTGKSKDDFNKIKTNLIERLDELNSQLKSNAETKELKNQINLEFLQLKQIITDLELKQPLKKDTEKPSDEDTEEEEESKNKTNKLLINQISKNF